MGGPTPTANGDSAQIHATRLPGAFLFFTYKLKTGESFAGISYDPDVVETTKLKDLQTKYFSQGLPYTERFTPIPTPDKSPVWEEPSNTVSYGGIYGGADPKTPPKKRIDLWGAEWPWVKENDHLKHGVHMLYWNYASQKEKKGMCTQAPFKDFRKDNKIPFVGLYPGPGKGTNLVPTTSMGTSIVTELYLDHYATKWDKSLGWEKL